MRKLIATAFLIALVGGAGALAAVSPTAVPLSEGATASARAAKRTLSYPIVDTSQTLCYGNAARIACPKKSASFYGQDAQHRGSQADYTVSTDKKTVHDNVTDLTWQRSPDTSGDGAITYDDKLTLTQAEALPGKLNAAGFGGYRDWRLPTIKELYSLINFNGVEPNPQAPTAAGARPFIDTTAFAFSYGFTGSGERIIDAQYASSTLYPGSVAGEPGPNVFGVNFADGRIKGYGTPPGSAETRYFVICVRGTRQYGKNRFRDNGNQTITDRATGLTWTKNDSKKGMNWQQALAWAQRMNAKRYRGHSDWGLPNAKELQSILDYTRQTEATKKPAINPAFNVTTIKNEEGGVDYPYYWTSTTHSGREAAYVAFGRGLGYIDGEWMDIHGSGTQRTDPKAGNARQFPNGRGPQGDAVRINNYVRLVRG